MSDYELTETGPHHVDGERFYYWKITATAPNGKPFTYMTRDGWSLANFAEEAQIKQVMINAWWRAYAAAELAEGQAALERQRAAPKDGSRAT